MFSLTLSNAARVIACPGSVQLAKRVYIERETNRTQLEGKTADWCIARVLRGESLDDPPYGVPVTDDMIDHVNGYIAHIRDTLAQYGVTFTDRSEYTVSLRSLTEDHKDIKPWAGRSDFQFFIPEHGVLLVWDFKYGHLTVEAVDNPQLVGAALDDSTRHNTKLARMFIYQPRDMQAGEPIKEWQQTGEQLKHWNQTFRSTALAANRPDAPLNCGSHCYGCNAAGTVCPEITEVTQMYKSVLDAPPSTTAAEVGERLQMVRELNELSGYMKDTLVQQGLTLAKQGHTVLGHKVVRSITRRVVKSADDLIALAPLYGHSEDDVTERKPASLGKLEKLFGKDLIGVFTEKPDGKLELVPVSDKRDAVIKSPDEAFSTPAPVINTGA